MGGAGAGGRGRRFNPRGPSADLKEAGLPQAFGKAKEKKRFGRPVEEPEAEEDDGLTAEERAKVAEMQKKLTPFQPSAMARAAALGGGGDDLMASLRGEEKEDDDDKDLTEAEKRLASIRKRMVQRKREAQKVRAKSLGGACTPPFRPPLAATPPPAPIRTHWAV